MGPPTPSPSQSNPGEVFIYFNKENYGGIYVPNHASFMRKHVFRALYLAYRAHMLSDITIVHGIRWMVKSNKVIGLQYPPPHVGTKKWETKLEPLLGVKIKNQEIKFTFWERAVEFE